MFELKRKTLHLSAAFYLIFYWLVFTIFESHQIAMLFSLSILLIFLAAEYFRIREKKRIPVIHVFFRAKEENTLGGQVYMIIGILLAVGLFEFRIAVAAILMMIFGDFAAAIFGIAFGKHWIKQLNETAWEGIFAELIVDVIIGLILLKPIIAIPMAITATLVETTLPHVDDNLAIPVFAGFVGQGLRLLFP